MMLIYSNLRVSLISIISRHIWLFKHVGATCVLKNLGYNLVDSFTWYELCRFFFHFDLCSCCCLQGFLDDSQRTYQNKNRIYHIWLRCFFVRNIFYVLSITITVNYEQARSDLKNDFSWKISIVFIINCPSSVLLLTINISELFWYMQTEPRPRPIARLMLLCLQCSTKNGGNQRDVIWRCIK